MVIAQIFIGFLLGGLIGLLAWRVRALSISGAWAATIIGGLIFCLGGLSWAVLLLTFFISSSGLSRAFSRHKANLGEKFAKGGQRDWAQVFANGGIGALLVIINAFYPEQFWPWIAYAGAMATVNADTWATELGVLSGKPPRLITTGQIVERGTSGGYHFFGHFSHPWRCGADCFSHCLVHHRADGTHFGGCFAGGIERFVAGFGAGGNGAGYL